MSERSELQALVSSPSYQAVLDTLDPTSKAITFTGESNASITATHCLTPLISLTPAPTLALSKNTNDLLHHQHGKRCDTAKLIKPTSLIKPTEPHLCPNNPKLLTTRHATTQTRTQYHPDKHTSKTPPTRPPPPD
jgi:hypothetical protein